MNELNQAEELVPEFLAELIPSALLAVVALLGGRLLARAAKKLTSFLENRTSHWFGILIVSFSKPFVWMIQTGLIAVALVLLPLDGTAHTAMVKIATYGSRIIGALLLAKGLWEAAPLCGLLLQSAKNKMDMESRQTVLRFFVSIYKVMVAVMCGIMVLDILGVPVTGLITGAGVAGLAVSLGAQSALADLIAGVTLVLEHPFAIGDYIKLGDYEGTVEDISFRTTRIRTMDHVLITVENSKVCDEYIMNQSSRSSRLWEFEIGLVYGTTAETLKKFCEDLTLLLRQDAQVVDDMVYVTVQEFADSSINVQVRVYVTALGLAELNELKSRINLQIMELVEKDGCSFAFPSTSVYVETMPTKQ